MFLKVHVGPRWPHKLPPLAFWARACLFLLSVCVMRPGTNPAWRFGDVLFAGGAAVGGDAHEDASQMESSLIDAIALGIMPGSPPASRLLHSVAYAGEGADWRPFQHVCMQLERELGFSQPCRTPCCTPYRLPAMHDAHGRCNPPPPVEEAECAQLHDERPQLNVWSAPHPSHCTRRPTPQRHHPPSH